MPLHPNAAEAHRYGELNEAPAAQLDHLATIGFRAAGAALRLGVFDALADRPNGAPAPDADSLATCLETDPRATETLLSTLVSFGYLVRTADGYANSALAERWLRTDEPGGYATVFNFWQTVVFELWSDLEESIRTGGRMADFYSWIERRPQLLADFQGMLSQMAAELGPEVVDLVQLPSTARRLLDIGGGHARYSLAFCRRYSDLSATVLDLPGALECGARAVAGADLGHRITLQAGHWQSMAPVAEYDLVLLFNVLHGNGPEENAELVRAAVAALRPRGAVALLGPLAEVSGDAGPVGEASVRAFSLNLLHTQGGRVYRRDEVAGWLTSAGLADVTSRVLRSAPTEYLITARLPA